MLKALRLESAKTIAVVSQCKQINQNIEAKTEASKRPIILCSNRRSDYGRIESVLAACTQQYIALQASTVIGIQEGKVQSCSTENSSRALLSIPRPRACKSMVVLPIIFDFGLQDGGGHSQSRRIIAAQVAQRISAVCGNGSIAILPLLRANTGHSA